MCSPFRKKSKSIEICQVKLMKAIIVISSVVLASLTPSAWAVERDVFAQLLAKVKLAKGAGLDATGTRERSLVAESHYGNAKNDSAQQLASPGSLAEPGSQSELLSAPTTREGLSQELARPGALVEPASQSELLSAQPTREGLSQELARAGALAEPASQSELLSAPTRDWGL
jgi:hypothetical protein